MDLTTLTTAQIAALSTDQIAALSTTNILALTSAQAITIGVGAVEKFGHMDMVVNDQTGSGNIRMMIRGDTSDTVTIVDATQWHDAGTTVVDGEAFRILSDGHAQLLIGVRIHHDPVG